MAASVVARRLALAGAGTAVASALASTTVAAAGLRALVRARPHVPVTGASVTAVEHRSDGIRHVRLHGPDAATAGWVSLEVPAGRVLAGPPVPDGDTTVRAVVDVDPYRQVPLTVGQQVVVGGDPFTGAARPNGYTVTETVHPSPYGPVHASVVGPPDATRAVVYVHGRGGSRATGHWVAPTAADRGWQTVLPSYRNDPDGPDGRGRYLLGGEWEDLAIVLSGLAETGVRQVVLVGWSMGGNIVASYLRARLRDPGRFAHHPQPAGVVLDAPALDWGRVLSHVARSRKLPAVFAPLVMTYGQLAARIDWRDLNHLTELEHLHLPVLVFHGTHDAVVPITISEELAAGLDHVELEVFDGADHCRSVNLDPARYLTRFGSFLDRL